MIRFLKHNQIDFQKWDNCLSKCINNNIYAQSWFLNIVCDKWHALVLDDYQAVMPLNHKPKWGLLTIRQAIFSQQLGLFCQNNKIDVDDFISAIPKKYLYINFNLNTSNKSSVFSFKKNINHEIFLDSDKNKIFANYSKSVKKNISKAINNSVVFSNVADSVDEFCKHKKHLGKNYMNDKRNKIHFNLINYCLINKKGKIFSVSYQGINCCSVFVTFFNNRITLHSSYCNEIGKKNGAFFFLLNHIFNLEEFNNFIFDFEGSNLDGVAKRNLGFGAKQTYYQSVKLSRIPFL
jgi:hypothetical protein